MEDKTCQNDIFNKLESFHFFCLDAVFGTLIILPSHLFYFYIYCQFWQGQSSVPAHVNVSGVVQLKPTDWSYFLN